MLIAQIGNFEPEFSTENELRHALETLGHIVVPLQEGDPRALEELIGGLTIGDTLAPSFVLWTRTKGLADKWGHEGQWRFLAEARRRRIPVVGYHLDRWWGLKRETELHTEPFFQVDLLCTADGGHQEEWKSIGANHVWFPPAISERWCQRGNFREEYACDVVFVGGGLDYGHREWKHRAELITNLSNWYGDRFKLIPGPGRHAIRGLELNDVYESATVVVGDSCLVPNPDGSPATHYCSDRIPETLGRGGLLLHPFVDGVDGLFGRQFGWPLGDWAGLLAMIDGLLGGPDSHVWVPHHPGDPIERDKQIESIRENHTYTVRMAALIDLLQEQGMIDRMAV